MNYKKYIFFLLAGCSLTSINYAMENDAKKENKQNDQSYPHKSAPTHYSFGRKCYLEAEDHHPDENKIRVGCFSVSEKELTRCAKTIETKSKLRESH